MRFREGCLVALAACAPSVGCAPYHPPFSVSSITTAGGGTTGTSPAARAAPHQATVVFLWPETSCDPGGYYTLVTREGRFVGNVAAGTQLRAELPAGETTIVGWNEVQEEIGGPGNGSTIPVLRGRLAEGRTYYVQMLFGEWDERGPRDAWWGLVGRGPRMRACLRIGPEGTTSAMERLVPSSRDWREIPRWLAKLEPIAPERGAGQAWVDAQGDALRRHIVQGEERYEGLKPDAREMATVAESDGVDRDR
jgi:hypothetical protein